MHFAQCESLLARSGPAVPSPPPPASSAASRPRSPGPLALQLMAREVQRGSINTGRLSVV